MTAILRFITLEDEFNNSCNDDDDDDDKKVAKTLFGWSSCVKNLYENNLALLDTCH